MLGDLERKLLRILYNFSAGRRRMPTMKELEIKKGRRTEDIKAMQCVIIPAISSNKTSNGFGLCINIRGTLW